jgi:ribulose-phosphate 3-epimerase
LIAFVSLWSADALAIGEAVDLVDAEVDGYHVDVMDGRMVDDLLFGPAIVAALRGRTTKPIEAHLMVDDAERWIGRFADAGADLITLHPRSCRSIERALAATQREGAAPGVAVELGDRIEGIQPYVEDVERLLVMGTELGIKGASLDPAAPRRVAEAAALASSAARRPAVVVDGGIRRETVPDLAAAGADGVIPGSLVYGDPSPADAIRWLRSLGMAAVTGREPRKRR